MSAKMKKKIIEILPDQLKLGAIIINGVVGAICLDNLLIMSM